MPHLGTQEGKGRGHGRVLVLERELARIRVRLYHCASNQAAVGRFSLRGVANNLGLDVLGDSLKPLGNRHLSEPRQEAVGIGRRMTQGTTDELALTDAHRQMRAPNSGGAEQNRGDCPTVEALVGLTFAAVASGTYATIASCLTPAEKIILPTRPEHPLRSSELSGSAGAFIAVMAI